VKPDLPRPRLVEEERRCGIDDFAAQLIPRIALCEYIFGQTFRAVAAIGFLNGFENQIAPMP
jgi:hypothetical protein